MERHACSSRRGTEAQSQGSARGVEVVNNAVDAHFAFDGEHDSGCHECSGRQESASEDKDSSHRAAPNVNAQIVAYE